MAAPHREVLRHASLVVTHGGHGPLMKAFAAGLPVVVLPHGRDRPASPPRWRGCWTDPATVGPRRALGEAIRRDADSGRLVAELEGLDPAPPA